VSGDEHSIDVAAREEVVEIALDPARSSGSMTLARMIIAKYGLL
jgi:hypothetical protein